MTYIAAPVCRSSRRREGAGRMFQGACEHRVCWLCRSRRSCGIGQLLLLPLYGTARAHVVVSCLVDPCVVEVD